MAFPERKIPEKRTRHILGALVFATLVCTGLLVVRCACAGNLRFSGLFANLLLAWIPLILAIVLWRMPKVVQPCKFRSLMVLWILFFPNAFYLVTDLIHMKKFGQDGIFKWFDLLMTTSFATAGMFLGCLSLYLLQLYFRQRYGGKAAWGFAGTMLALGAFGIFLGRALRLNSWDVVARPLKLMGDLSGLLAPPSAREAAAFSVTFFLFSGAVYAVFVSLARLHEAD